MSAAQRVQAFCDSHDGWEGEQDFVTSTGHYNSADAVTLSKADLRELLAENERLTEHLEWALKARTAN